MTEFYRDKRLLLAHDSVLPFPIMAFHKLATVVAGCSLLGASLPSLSAGERFGAQGPAGNQTHDPISKERVSVGVEQAIERYRDRIREIYLANGKEETLLSDQIYRFEVAAKEVLGDVVPLFDTVAFDRLSLVDKVNYLSKGLYDHGYIVGNFDVTAETRDGRMAVLSINVDRVLSSDIVTCGDLDFSLIGLPSNPLPKTLPFFETSCLISETPGAIPLTPVSALAIDLKRKTYGVVLGHDSVARYLPGYDASKHAPLSQGVRDFLTDWALGRLAYHVGGDKGMCDLPQAFTYNGRTLPLRNVMGLAYAFSRSTEESPQLAILVCNFLGLTGGSPDSFLLATASQIIRERLAERFPGIEELRQRDTTSKFFESNPEAAKAYLRALRASVLKQVQGTKEEMERQKNGRRQRFSI